MEIASSLGYKKGVDVHMYKPKKILLCFLILVLVGVYPGCAKSEMSSVPKPSLEEEFVDGQLDFSFSVFQELVEEEETKSIFISPLSISMALSMAMNGAKGQTRQEMMEALSLKDLDLQLVNESYAHLYEYINAQTSHRELLLKNSLWIREGEILQQDYLDLVQQDYQAYIDYLDFGQDDAADTMNGWIEEATKGKITDMLAPPLPPEAVLYLINAIYFKSDWQHEFAKEDTFEAEFTMEDGSMASVDMMKQTRTVLYMEEEGLQAIDLPYQDETTSMIFLLPRENQSIDSLIDQLDTTYFRQVLESLRPTDDLIVQIPKFKMEYGVKNINQVLQNLGMIKAFQDSADFSGMRDGLYISRVLHKAFIEINEQGSEAAAATVVEMLESSMQEPLVFRADHPFVFIIYEKETDTILFIGKYNM